MERHAHREEAVRHCLEQRLGGAEVRIVVDHLSREIVFYVDADGEHPSHRPLQLSFEVIADYGTRQLAEFLDSLNVIERMRAAGSEPVIVSKGLG
jgi:hypothetical protein